jgi:hypothetical protein
MKAGITIAEGVSAGRGAEAARLLAKNAIWPPSTGHSIKVKGRVRSRLALYMR